MLKNKSFSSIATALLFTVSGQLFLVNSASAEQDVSGEDMFTQCGIGAMIFPENPTLAVISNITWDSGTTAVTSGLSGAGCSGSKFKSATLVYKKYAEIELETVRGHGEHLTALMDIFQCNSSAQNTVIENVRTEFADVLEDQATYNTMDRLGKARTYHDILTNNLDQDCNIT